MPLSDLNKRLYDTGKEQLPKNEDHISLDKGESGQKDPSFAENTEVWKSEAEEYDSGKKSRRRKAIILICLIVVVIASVSTYMTIRLNAFKEEMVSISFEGPTEVKGGEKAKYLIRIKNRNKTELNNVQLDLNYSEKFRPSQDDSPELEIINESNSKVNIGKVGSRQEKQVVISGTFYSPEDYTVYLKGKIFYSPGSFTARYDRDNQIGVRTVSSYVFAELTAPSSATDGDPVAYVIDYQNSGGDLFKDARVEVQYPNGFEFSSSEPKPSEGNNKWDVGDLVSGMKGKIVITGSLKGIQDEGKMMRVFIGSLAADGTFLAYSKIEKNTSIKIPPLAISLSGSTITDRGGEMVYVIGYKNNGNSVLRDLIVRLEAKGTLLDFTRIQPGKGGYYDGETSTVVWRYSEIPALAFVPSGAEGQVQLKVPVVKSIPIQNENDKNFTISATAMIDTPSILDPRGNNKILYSAPLNTKINTAVNFSAYAAYDDSNIENTGPFPVELGKETSFVINWEITNDLNDISGVRVVSTIPSGVKWTGKIYPSGEKLTYTERTGEIFWDVGNVPAGKGVLNEKKSVAFQVSIVPQINQDLFKIKLINDANFFSKDVFTGRDINITAKSKTTSLKD